MRIIYFIEDTIDAVLEYPSRWFSSSSWYDAGVIIAYILQFLAGIGIGWVIKDILRAIGLC